MSWDMSFGIASQSLTADAIDKVLRDVAREFRLEVWRDKTDGALEPGDEGFAEAAADPDIDGEPLTWRFRFREVDGARPTAALHFSRDDGGWQGSTSSFDVDPACLDELNYVFERTRELLGGVMDDSVAPS